MIKEILEGIADVITSEKFPSLFIMSIIMFLFGLMIGCITTDFDVKTQCDEMSITEALKYPYCRNYYEKELEKIDD